MAKKKIIKKPVKKATKPVAKSKPIKKKKAAAPVKRKKSKSVPVKRKARKIIHPKKQLTAVRKEIAKARQPLYSINRKLKNAKNQYQARKIKKARKELLAELQPKVEKLVTKRTELKVKVKRFKVNRSLKEQKLRKIASIKRKKIKADENTDYKELESLSYQEIKLMGEVDKLDEEMGATLEKQDIEDFDYEEQDGGKDFELDGSSPYGIWQAVSQLHEDMRSGAFRYFIINGNRYSADKTIEIISESTDFWTQQKSANDGTPYINRFINFKTDTVKYKGITT